MAPPYLVPFTFLGQPVTNGVNPVLAGVLAAVEASLRAIWLTSGELDFFAWAGLTEPSIGFRKGDGLHASGSAVDLNVTQVPYIVTRTGTTIGGEAAADGQPAMRRRAVEVYDRAVAFGTWTRQAADVSIRATDTIETTYDRFREVSDALVFYLSWAISARPIRVGRAPIPDVHSLPDGAGPLLAIPAQELSRPAPAAIAAIAELFAFPDWQATHPNWPLTAERQYWQMLRDYEMVRIPMLHGDPRKPIVATRNPAHGFLQLRRELVVATISVGDRILSGTQRMRWGASDFGAKHSGDVMHFDLGSHGVFVPE